MTRRASRLLILILVAVLSVLAGCGGPARPGATADTESTTAQTESPTEAEGTNSESKSAPAQIPNPHSITGPTTASAVPPVVPLDETPMPTLPATITDDKGRQVTVSSADRILALDIYGTLTETVIALGLGDQLVGRTISTTDPAYQHLPNVTPAGHELNAEAILAIAPTVVLADGTLGPQEIYTQLEQSGVSVVFASPERGLELIAPQITAVAEALGVEDAGQELNQRVEAELAEAATSVQALSPTDPAKMLRVAFLYVRGGGSVFFIFGKGSGADGLITALGAIDVASEAGITDYKPASAESLALIDPDLVLMMSSGLESAGGIDGILTRPGMAATTAGTKQRIVDMEDGAVLAFGPNYAKVLVSLANAIYLGE